MSDVTVETTDATPKEEVVDAEAEVVAKQEIPPCGS